MTTSDRDREPHDRTLIEYVSIYGGVLRERKYCGNELAYRAATRAHDLISGLCFSTPAGLELLRVGVDWPRVNEENYDEIVDALADGFGVSMLAMFAAGMIRRAVGDDLDRLAALLASELASAEDRYRRGER